MDVKSFIALSIIRSLGLLSLPAARRFGRFIGWLLIKTNSRSLKVTRKNLEICYPQMAADEREALAEESLIHTGQTIAETGIAWGGTPEKYRRNYKMVESVENQHLFDEALEAKKGLMILTPHLGNWEFFSSWFPVYSDMMVLYKMAKMPGLEKAMVKARVSWGLKLARGNSAGIKNLIEHYENQKAIAILPDQEPSERSGVWADFFGVPALTPKIVHSIIQRNPEGKVLFSYLLRTETGLRIVFREPPEEIYSEDPVDSAKAMNQGIEACIADDPKQYQWGYKRFKRNKDGFYKGL